MIILDISQFSCNLEEAEMVIKALKYSENGAAPDKDQVLIVVSSPMTWSQTPKKADGSAYTDKEVNKRVPLPKYLLQKQIEHAAVSLT